MSFISLRIFNSWCSNKNFKTVLSLKLLNVDSCACLFLHLKFKDHSALLRKRAGKAFISSMLMNRLEVALAPLGNHRPWVAVSSLTFVTGTIPGDEQLPHRYTVNLASSLDLMTSWLLLIHFSMTGRTWLAVYRCSLNIIWGRSTISFQI